MIPSIRSSKRSTAVRNRALCYFKGISLPYPEAGIQARCDEAVQMAEQAFVEELPKLVSHLTERLTGSGDNMPNNMPKVCRDSAVENLTEFFQRFRQLNVRSNEQLDQLVERAQQIVRGVESQQLRDNQPLRKQVASDLSAVQSVLDGLLVDRPRRNILQRSK